MSFGGSEASAETFLFYSGYNRTILSSIFEFGF
jgi:hypothetical protein